MNLIDRICVEECNRFIRSVLSESDSASNNRSVLLSIQPKFADKIFDHTKKYEYRKVIFSSDINKVYVYSSSPICQIIGYFIIDEIIKGTPSTVWRKTSKDSGITREYFDDYFEGHDTAFAIKIKSVKQFKTPINPKKIIKNFRPPQNFMYYDG